jgi:hypothetical protein
MEDLELEVCKFSGDCSQGITSYTLKKLVLNYCENNTSHPMVITAPSLSCLELASVYYQAGIILSNTDSHDEANIYVYASKGAYPVSDMYPTRSTACPHIQTYLGRKLTD